MRVSEIKEQIGGEINQLFSYEVNHYSRFLILVFNQKPSQSKISFIESNGCVLKESKWEEVDKNETKSSIRWEVWPKDIADYEFMGFWEESGGFYKHHILESNNQCKDGWLSLDDFKKEVENIMLEYKGRNYDLNYTNGSTRSWFYRDMREFEQSHLSARYWAGVQLMYKITNVSVQEGKNICIQFDRNVY